MQMRRLILLAILCATPSAWAAAQAGRFDVASVRAGGIPGSFPSVSILPGGRISAPNVTLRELIRNAYSVDENRILGGPEWIAEARFAVEAKAARADATPSQLQAMLAALLAERFGLKIRREPRALPVFLLTLARSDGRLGPALRRAGVACESITPPPGVPPRPPWVDSLPRTLTLANTEGRCPTMSVPGWMVGRAITMAQLAARLKPYAGRPVIDRTNLAGEFAFELRYGPELPPIVTGARVPPTSDGESLFTAVREQLGLALKAARGPVDVIVIDGAQRPTEN
jgi:uncharacterized protein (TIGR03435 family)